MDIQRSDLMEDIIKCLTIFVIVKVLKIRVCDVNSMITLPSKEMTHGICWNKLGKNFVRGGLDENT